LHKETLDDSDLDVLRTQIAPAEAAQTAAVGGVVPP
jgi:hypothetical protein